MADRKCAGCGKILNRDNMIKITKQKKAQSLVVNGNSKIFGRSVYRCENKSCIEAAFKKKKLQKALRAPIPQELKGKILNEF